MSMLDAGTLGKQIKFLWGEAAAALLSKALNHALDTDPDFFAPQNWDAAFPVLVMLAQRDPVRTEAFFERFQAKYEQGSTEWARKALNDQLALLEREEQLRSLSSEELEAQLVFVSLLPSGKPASEIEQEALVRALLVHQPERACMLAASWWGGKWQFEKTVVLLFERCWKSDPEALLTLLLLWHGGQRENLIYQWTERVIQQWGTESSPWIIRLVCSMHDYAYREHRSIAVILNALAHWTLEERRPVLAALVPTLHSAFPYTRGPALTMGIQALEKLWALDSGSEWEWQLHPLLYRMPPADRLKLTRQLKHSKLPRSFSRAAHAMALIANKGKTLSDYLNRKYVRSDHRRRWRRFIALESKIQMVPDELLRAELLKSHAAVVKETSRARKGQVLAALNTDTDKPISVRPVKSK